MNDERMFAFEDLQVWHKAIAFAKIVIEKIDQFDAPRKHYRLIEQLESAVVSISSNIAEGKGRFSTKEFLHFLYIARGSLFESVSQLILIHELGWIQKEKLNNKEHIFKYKELAGQLVSWKKEQIFLSEVHSQTFQQT